MDDHLGTRELVQFVTKPNGAIVFKSPGTQKIGCLRGTNRFFFAKCSADFGHPFRCIDHLDPRKIILVGGLEPWNFMTFHILGSSSSHLMNSIIFQRGRSTTNQIYYSLDQVLITINHYKSLLTTIIPYYSQYIG